MTLDDDAAPGDAARGHTAGGGRYQPVTLGGTAKRVTVFVDETDQFHHRPVYAEIVRRAHASGLAGATVIRGIEGYGAGRHVHTQRLLSLSEDLPLMVVLVDTPERVSAFLPELVEVVRDGLVVVDDVEVVLYSGRRPSGAP